MTDLLTGKPWAQAPWELVTADISAIAFRVIMAIQLHRRPEGEAPFPSQERLAGMCRVSVPTIKRAIHELRENGYLEVTARRRKNGSKTTSAYALKLPEQRITRDPRATEQGITCDTNKGSHVILPEVEEGEVDQLPPSGEACASERPPTLALVRTRGALVTSPSEVVDTRSAVAFYVDQFRSRTQLEKPPDRELKIVARYAKELVDGGVPPAVVGRAIELMFEKNVHPSVLPTLIREAAGAKRSTTRYGRGMTTRSLIEMSKRLEEQGR